MKLTYDTDHGLLYLQLTPEERNSAQTETLAPGVFADFDEDGRIIGIELIGVEQVVGPRARVEVIVTQQEAG